MPAVKTFDSLTLDEMVRRVVRTQDRSKGRVPFTLLLGAGFSFPVIPGAREMLLQVPDWLHEGEPDSKPPIGEYRKQFWERVGERSRRARDRLVLDGGGQPDLSRPESVGESYQAAMRHGLYLPRDRRLFLRAVISRAGRKINPAHLFLAGILKAQDHRGRTFCRTVFTTNFDPLLQRGLQLVNKLYYMTDRPETIEDPEEESQEAVHLIYTHGSVHRYWLATTGSQIRLVTQKAAQLQGFFREHGVIVMGYSGWADVCMEALRRCLQFDLGLYWCDIHPSDQAASRLRPEVVELLLGSDGGDRFYVHLPGGADDAMQHLHHALGYGGAPSLVLDPLTPLIHALSSISVTETGPAGSSGPGGRAARREADPVRNLDGALERTQERLSLAQKVFADPDKGLEGVQAAVVAKLLNEALEFHSSGSPKQAIERWDRVIEKEGVPPEQRARALFYRGSALGGEGDAAGELRDYTAVIEMPGVPPTWLAWALFNRAAVRHEQGELEAALADYEAVLALSEATAEQRARALLNRGLIRGVRGDAEGEEADYKSVIEMGGAPDELRALAFFNRGYVRDERGDQEAALADYQAVLEISNAPVRQRALALRNRAEILEKRGEIERALADYTSLVQLAELPAGERAVALSNRAEILEKLGDTEGARADVAAIDELPDAPAEAFANVGWLHFKAARYEESARYSARALDVDPEAAWVRANLGLALLHLQRTEEALEAYRAAAAAFEDPADLREFVEDDLAAERERTPDLPGLEEALAIVAAQKAELQEVARPEGGSEETGA